MYKECKVQWKDSVNKIGWINQEYLEKYSSATCFTKGILVKETQENICIAQTLGKIDNEFKFNNIIIIPKCCLVNITISDD